MIFLICLFLCATNAGVYIMPKDIPMAEAFEEYNKFFNKSHACASEKQLRYFNFLDSSNRINELNKNRPTENSAWFGFTDFSDMSVTEFKITMNGLKITKPINVSVQSKLEIPSGAINWVQAGKNHFN